VEKDCQARKLNREDAMDCNRWRKQISRAVRKSEFTIAVITVIFAVYRDFWPLP